MVKAEVDRFVQQNYNNTLNPILDLDGPKNKARLVKLDPKAEKTRLPKLTGLWDLDAPNYIT